MARIDYWGIKDELREIIDANVHATVTVEADMQFAAELSPWVCVYLDGRDVPEGQPIAAGRVVRMSLRLSVWVWVHNLELKTAERGRDSLLGDIELILMGNRTLNDKVDGLVLDGGELPSNRNPASPGFFCGGEIKIVTDIRAGV